MASDCLASRAVAQPVTTAFTAASVTRTTVSSAMTWLTRPLTGSLSPANQSKRPADTSPAWCAASTATSR